MRHIDTPWNNTGYGSRHPLRLIGYPHSLTHPLTHSLTHRKLPVDLTGLKVIGFAPGFLPGFGHLASPPKRSLLGIVVTRVTGRGRQLRSTGRREMDRRRRLGEGRDGQRDRRTGGWGEGRDEEGRTEGQEEHGRPGSLGAAWSAAAHSWDLLQCVQSTPCGGHTLLVRRALRVCCASAWYARVDCAVRSGPAIRV